MALQSTIDMTDGVTRLPVEVAILAVSSDIVPQFCRKSLKLSINLNIFNE